MSIEEYLAELECRLRIGRRAKGRIAQEISAHLQDAAHEEEQRGAGRIEAERRAVDRFGSAEMLAARFPRTPRRRLVAGAAVGVVLVAEATTALVLAVSGNPRHSPLALSVTLSTSPHKVVARGSGTQSTLTPTSSSITVDGSSTSTITVQGVDANGNYVTSSGSTVTFTNQSGTGRTGPVTITATIAGSGR
jgi:hypothetical protein